jgi:hypothetical protein
VAAPRSGPMLAANEVFAVSDSVVLPDRRLYLRLADGRGWVFDNTLLVSEDPCVLRGYWATTPAANCTAPMPASYAVPNATIPYPPAPMYTASLREVGGTQPPEAVGLLSQGYDVDPGHEARRWMRGKRGGVKKHRPRRQQNQPKT